MVHRTHSAKVVGTLVTWLAPLVFATVFVAPRPCTAQGQSAGRVVTDSAAASLLERARTIFISGGYDEVSDLLQPTFGSESPPATGVARNTRIEALSMLAVAELLRTKPDRDEATRLLTSVLEIEPRFHFVSGMAPPEADALLDELRRSARHGDGVRGDGGIPEESSSPVYIQKEVTKRQFWVSFVPLGVGQFQNGDTGQAVFFLLTEVIALGINVGSYAVVEGLRGPSGLYDEDAARAAEAFQTAQFISLGALVALVSWGIADALYFYEPSDTEIRTLDSAPPELAWHGVDGNRTPWRRAGFSSNAPRSSAFRSAGAARTVPDWAQPPPSGMVLGIEVPF